MSSQRRTLSTVRNINDISQVLNDRRNPPRPAFTTYSSKHVDMFPSATMATTSNSRASSQTRLTTATTTQLFRGSSCLRAVSKNNPSSITSTPRTIATVALSSPESSNLAVLIAKDVSRQRDITSISRNTCNLNSDRYKIAINRRYDMVVDEASVLQPDQETEEKDVHSSPSRRLIRPVSKVGLRSDYYVPNRKHTMEALHQSIKISLSLVSETAARLKGTQNGPFLTSANITTIVDFIGKGRRCLGTIALVNKVFAAAVETKLAEEDSTATNDEVMRRLNTSRSAVASIPRAFFNAVRSLRTNPPAKVMEALRIVMLVLEGSAALVTNPDFDGQAATLAFKTKLELRGADMFIKDLVDFSPSCLTYSVAYCIKGSLDKLEGLRDAVNAYNSHTGTLVEWANAILNVACCETQ